jgi:hypothetical protein
MSYPGTNIHRHSRRKLGRGQYPPLPIGSIVTSTVTSTGTTNVTITFSAPVQPPTSVPISITGLTVGPPTIVSPTQITLVASSAVAGLAYNLPTGAILPTSGGGTVAGATGTF